VQTGECLCGVYWIGFGLKKEGVLTLFPFGRALFVLCNLGGKTNKNGLKLNGRFSFLSMVMMLADCKKTNLHVSKKMKERLSCSLVKTSV
jgi:hypothetical protein